MDFTIFIACSILHVFCDFVIIFLSEMSKAKNSFQAMETKLKTLKVTGEAGAGLVKASVNGNKKFLTIDIDERLLHPTEKTTLQDLMVAAVNVALTKLQQTTKEEIGQMLSTPDLMKEFL